MAEARGPQAQAHRVHHAWAGPAAACRGAGGTRPRSRAGTGTGAGRAGRRGTWGRMPARICRAAMHRALAAEEVAEARPEKSGQRRRAGRGRAHYISVRHAGCGRPDGGRRLAARMDGASRLMIGFGAFDAAAGRHVLDVLGRASGRGRPASVPAGHWSQSCAYGGYPGSGRRRSRTAGARRNSPRSAAGGGPAASRTRTARRPRPAHSPPGRTRGRSRKTARAGQKRTRANGRRDFRTTRRIDWYTLTSPPPPAATWPPGRARAPRKLRLA